MIEEKIKEAVSLFRSEKYSDAKKICKDIVSGKGNDPRPLNILAAIEKQIGNEDEAIEILNKTILDFPNDVQSYFNLGKIYQDLNQNKIALKNFEKAKSLKKDFFQADISIAKIHLSNSDSTNALEHLKNVKKLKPNLEGLNYLFGRTFFIENNYEESEDYLNKELIINKKNGEAFFLLGQIFRIKNDYDLAIKYYNESLKINQYELALLNLSSCLLELDRFDEAEEKLNTGIKSYPKNYLFNLNLAILYEQKGEYNKLLLPGFKALEIYDEVTLKNTEVSDFEKNFALLINRVEANSIITQNALSKDDYNKISNFLIRIINKDNFDISLLNNSFQTHILRKFLEFNIRSDKDLLDSKTETFINILNDELFQYYLKNESVDLIYIENFLVEARSRFLELLAKNKFETIKEEDIFKCLEGISLQCENNEYIWNISKNDLINRDHIYKRYKSSFSNNENYLIALASIDRLNTYKELEILNSNSKNNFDNLALREIYKRQIIDTKKEKSLQKNIKELNPIKDKVSEKVRSQYEQNPYPRWQMISLAKEQKYNLSIQRDIRPNKLGKTVLDKNSRILIAGCGTGAHPIQIAQRAQDSKITALDLSKASLSYGIRKAEELNINNIEWVQGDILDASLLNTKFDCIESVGVLHHMESPKKGFLALTKILKPKGLFRLGLYSYKFKSQFLEVQKDLKSNNYKSSIEDIRKVREYIKNSNSDACKKIVSQVRDFFMTSDLRDLLLHEQEHFFSMNEIRDLIYPDFEFLGFSNTNTFINYRIKEKYTREFPDDKSLTNLDNWERFENKNPDTFQNMYHMWLKKNQ
ncbi:MAG: methyltransferase domain-containing protein [Pseudomonadota bacterium]|nr:methyltransferase domain-containing protein [Pseudomonadota bacterium]